MFYKIIPDKKTKGTLIVSKGFMDGLFPANIDAISICAGLRNAFAKLVHDSKLKKDEIIMSEDIVSVLQIPAGIQYQVKFDGGGIRLGPVIGLLIAKSRGSLSSRKPDELLHYTLLYPQIKGLLVVFSLDGVDFLGKSVRGYYFNPDDKNSKASWEEKVLPFPDAVFSRIVVPHNLRLLFKESTSNRFFNSSYFDKWQFWKIMSRFDSIMANIPHTTPFTSMEDVDFMLHHYGAAYLKPLNGTLARGLIKVIKDEGRYIIRFKQDANPSEADSSEEAGRIIKEMTRGHKYLVQQALRPLKVEDRHMDFRVIMQKDHTLKWGCSGIISFIGNPGSICSNWGLEMTFDEVLSKYFNFSQEEIFKKRQEVIGVCKKVCDILDLTGENFGDLGFDVLIDEKLKVWVLEVNKRHYHSVPLWINDLQTFYAVKANPIKYAAAMSGFNVY